MIKQEIQQRLFELQDEKYRIFQAKLMPGVDMERIIGVRTPLLRKLAKEYVKKDGIELFLEAVPHYYYDEKNLHGFIISETKDYETAVAQIDAFLPEVDNWATCDLLRPKAFKKNRALLEKDIDQWLASEHTYTIRFGIEMIMTHFLDEDFSKSWLEKIAQIRSKEYYINMMIAWFFATALAKQWEDTIPYIEETRLEIWTHNKAIQKAVESYRITEEQKQYLRTLKHKEMTKKRQRSQKKEV